MKPRSRKKILTFINHCTTMCPVFDGIPPFSLLERDMKKLLILSVLGVLSLGLMAQSAMAFGDCSGKKHTGTTTAETSTEKSDKS